MEDHTFTFAVSGYTCGQTNVWGGRQAFVLWDRDTESLWWPTIGTAVSGPMFGAHLKLLDKALWSQTTWGVVKDNFPQVRVLDTGQDFKRPQSWPKYTGPFDRHRSVNTCALAAFELLAQVDQFTKLTVTNRTPVGEDPDQHDRLLPAKVREPPLFAFGVGQSSVRILSSAVAESVACRIPRTITATCRRCSFSSSSSETKAGVTDAPRRTRSRTDRVRTSQS